MNRDRIEEGIRRSKRIYESIPIPEGLDTEVKLAIQQEQQERKGSDRMNRSGNERNEHERNEQGRNGYRRNKNHKTGFGRRAGGLRRGVVLAGAVVVCWAAGLNISPGFAAAAAELPVIGAISKVLTFRVYDEADENRSIHMEIPQIQTEADQDSDTGTDTGIGTTAGTDIGTALVRDVNQEIQTLMDTYKKEAEQHISEYKQAFLDTGGTEEEFTAKDIKVDASYTVKSESNDVLSLVITANENWSGAYSVQYFYNLNLKTGTFVTLSDLLGTDYIQKANDSIKAQMKERQSRGDKVEYWDGSNGIEGFKTIDNQTKFYINEAGNPVLVFEKYELAPGAYGSQEFEIPR